MSSGGVISKMIKAHYICLFSKVKHTHYNAFSLSLFTECKEKYLYQKEEVFSWFLVAGGVLFTST